MRSTRTGVLPPRVGQKRQHVRTSSVAQPEISFDPQGEAAGGGIEREVHQNFYRGEEIPWNLPLFINSYFLVDFSDDLDPDNPL